LEHNWDEAWGYFGGARTYGSWSDEQLADSSHFDINDDGQTDLTREFCWGHSRNAGKRDFGSAASAPTTFTEDAWFGFAAGRQFLSEIDGDLSAEQQEQLLEYRDQAITAWEGAIAATVVHYINDVLADMNQMDTEDYDFAAHAKHWSEAKGFALGLQFNPHSPLSSTDFAALHNALGTAPVLSTADTSTRNAYRSALLDAKDRLGATYGFDDANLGGEHGEDGW